MQEYFDIYFLRRLDLNLESSNEIIRDTNSRNLKKKQAGKMSDEKLTDVRLNLL